MESNLRFTSRTLLLPPEPILIIINIERMLTFVTVQTHKIHLTSAITLPERSIEIFGEVKIGATAIRAHQVLEL